LFVFTNQIVGRVFVLAEQLLFEVLEKFLDTVCVRLNIAVFADVDNVLLVFENVNYVRKKYVILNQHFGLLRNDRLFFKLHDFIIFVGNDCN